MMKDTQPQQAPPLPQIPLLLRTLESPRLCKWREQEKAARLLGYLPQDTAWSYSVAPRLRAMLQWDTWSIGNSAADSSKLLFYRLLLVSIPLALVLTRLMSGPASPDPNHWISAFFGNLIAASLMAFLPVSLVHAAINDHYLHRVRAAAAASLARLGDTESIGLLIKVIKANWGLQSSTGCWQLMGACRKSLTRLLPTLTEADYGRLPSVTTPSLCWLLEHSGEPLNLEILEALGKVGDGRAVACVERIAAGRPSALQQKAERILPILLERQRQENDPKILLRPSDATGVMQAGLLRPSQPIRDAGPEQLLRACTREEEA
ncbi:MAG TPA: hypothetical protein VFA07_01320 [Chthonomonadaceae bacterium]|nr:hypothetical protein [Chthonomonadaceae bacterium]